MGGKTRTVKNLDLCPLCFLSLSLRRHRMPIFDFRGKKRRLPKPFLISVFLWGGKRGTFFLTGVFLSKVFRPNYFIKAFRQSSFISTSSPLFPVFQPPAGYGKENWEKKWKSWAEKTGNRQQYFVSHLIPHTRKQKCARIFFLKKLRWF